MPSQQLLWISCSIVSFILTIIMNALSTTGGLGTEDQAALSDKYSLPMTPPGWVFSIWGIIYLWQTVWQLWILVDSCRFGSELSAKEMLILNSKFYITWMLSGVCNILWIVLFGFELIALSSVALILIQVVLYTNWYANTKYLGELRLAVRSGDSAESASAFPQFMLVSRSRRVAYQIMVNNGIAFYAGWVSVASCLNFGLFLAYPLEMDVYAASWVALSLLLVLLLVYLVLDFWRFRSWLVYTYSPYLILIWALVGVYSKDDLNELSGFVVTLLSIVCVALVLKIVSGIIYERKGYMSEAEETSKDEVILGGVDV